MPGIVTNFNVETVVKDCSYPVSEGEWSLMSRTRPVADQGGMRLAQGGEGRRMLVEKLANNGLPKP